MTKELRLAWKPIIQVPESIPSAAFLEDKGFVEEYNAKVDADYEGNKRLKVLSYNDGIVRGSNPFAVALIANMVRPLGLNVATQAQLEQVLATSALPLRGQYEDTGLVLRSEGDPNNYLASNIASQVKHRGNKLKNPIVISLNDVDVVNDGKSNYGLAFVLRDDAKLIEAPILKRDGSFDSKNIDVNTGLPKKLGKGERSLYTRNSGLSWLYLNWDLNLGSDYENLANSYDYGRVVLVRDAVAGADLEKYTTELNAQYEQKKSELSARLQRATKTLDAGYRAALKELK